MKSLFKSLDTFSLDLFASTSRQLLNVRLSSIGDFASSHDYQFPTLKCQVTKSQSSYHSLPLFVEIKADHASDGAVTHHECIVHNTNGRTSMDTMKCEVHHEQQRL
ncbi:hypothetical protein B5807_02551 [Epicoccum nigrum]|uniref:Uncharacterized protein n=1 Tax=Epicoccum nigrum TaxID=105696 RepID=A0A1Y2MAT6_EPING|nr:hypothetical protein B5807_02551 [Epicoccum nigrum]